ncbi:putative membrane protein [Lyngbya aestuarii BL J]|uniref:Putative membrane protein n=1 Tax=Lyngbya aestuarii BL J TaxID=1348334 RepID=U7QAG2_9CYAN|nr:putative membrane protein [Lyngbya aestuarii BL J]
MRFLLKYQDSLFVLFIIFIQKIGVTSNYFVVDDTPTFSQ